MINGHNHGAALQLAVVRAQEDRCTVQGCMTPAEGDVAGGRRLCNPHGAAWVASGEFNRYAQAVLPGVRAAALRDFVQRVAAELAAAKLIDAGAFKGCSRSAQPVPVRTCALHTDCDAADAYAAGQCATARHREAA